MLGEDGKPIIGDPTPLVKDTFAEELSACITDSCE